MKEDGSTPEENIITYNSALKQYNEVVCELGLLEKRLADVDKLKQQQHDASEERQYTKGFQADELDAFMDRYLIYFICYLIQ